MRRRRAKGTATDPNSTRKQAPQLQISLVSIFTRRSSGRVLACTNREGAPDVDREVEEHPEHLAGRSTAVVFALILHPPSANKLRRQLEDLKIVKPEFYAVPGEGAGGIAAPSHGHGSVHLSRTNDCLNDHRSYLPPKKILATQISRARRSPLAWAFPYLWIWVRQRIIIVSGK